MELSLIRSLMEKQFYEEHRGSRCPMKLFSKDIQKVKRVIDKAMDDYDRSVSPDEVEALFLSDNPTLTTAQKQQYSALFGQIKTQQPMGKDIAQEATNLVHIVVGPGRGTWDRQKQKSNIPASFRTDNMLFLKKYKNERIVKHLLI